MPLPPAPSQRASLISPSSIPKSEKLAPSSTSPVHPEISVRKNAPKRSAIDFKLEAPVVKEAAYERPARPSSAKKVKSLKKSNGPSKLFVLDTNVLMHDPMCLFQFEEHDIYLPMIVLEELDSHKKGMTEVARNARQTSRSLDSLAAAPGTDMQQGLPLSTTGHIEAGGKLFFQTQMMGIYRKLIYHAYYGSNDIDGCIE